jgi:hypothetical protein
MTALIDTAAMLAPGGRVRLVEVDASEFSGGIHRFHYTFPHTPAEIDAANGDEAKLGPKPIFGMVKPSISGRFRYQTLSFQPTRPQSQTQRFQPRRTYHCAVPAVQRYGECEGEHHRHLRRLSRCGELPGRREPDS